MRESKRKLLKHRRKIIFSLMFHILRKKFCFHFSYEEVTSKLRIITRLNLTTDGHSSFLAHSICIY